MYSPQRIGCEGALGRGSCMARELQTWSTAVAVDLVPWSGSFCLSKELQTWSTAVTVEAVPEREVLACRQGARSCKLGLLQSAVALYWRIEVRCAAELLGELK